MAQQHKTSEFLRYFFRGYPGRTAALVALLVCSGLAEGIGIAALGVLFAMWIVTEFLFLRRLRVVMRASNNLGNGDLTARTHLVHEADEVGRLARTFDEMAELSKQHGMEMFAANDAAHLDAMNRMKDMMRDPTAMKDWFEGRRQEFDALPED